MVHHSRSSKLDGLRCVPKNICPQDRPKVSQSNNIMFSKQSLNTVVSKNQTKWMSAYALLLVAGHVFLYFCWGTVAGLAVPPSWSFMIQWSYVVNHQRKQPGIWPDNPKINNPIEWISNWIQIFKGHLGEVSAKLLHCWVGGFAQNDPDGSIASKVCPKEHHGEQVISPWARLRWQKWPLRWLWW